MALARVPVLSLLINREDACKAEIINFNIRAGMDLLGWHFSSFPKSSYPSGCYQEFSTMKTRMEVAREVAPW